MSQTALRVARSLWHLLNLSACLEIIWQISWPFSAQMLNQYIVAFFGNWQSCMHEQGNYSSHNVPTHAAQQSLDWSNLRVTIAFQIMEKLATRMSLELSLTIPTYTCTIFAKLQPNVQRKPYYSKKLNSFSVIVKTIPLPTHVYLDVYSPLTRPQRYMPWRRLGPSSPCRWDDKRP